MRNRSRFARWLAFAAVGCLIATGAAFAAGESGGWYVTPQIGGTFPDGARHQNDAPYYGGALGLNFNEDWSGELNAITGVHTAKVGHRGERITAFSADVVRVFDRQAVLAPFLTGGIGVIEDEPTGGSSSDNVLAEVGGGLLIRAWESEDGSKTFDLRPQVKVRYDNNRFDGHPTDLLVGLGFQFGFGASSAESEQIAAPPPPAAAPAPRPAPPAPAPPEPAKAVNPKCPNVPPGVAVDAQGCPLVGSITLRGVHFATNSAHLTPQSATILDPIAAELTAHPRLRIEVQGYTDGRASQAFNLKLSRARAESVREYLIAHGVPAEELTAKGYAKRRPVATNRTAAGRALNRRVVLSVLENPSGVKVEHTTAGR